MDESSRFRAIVSGLVQGVSFRYYTSQRARQLGLKGYVKNRWDGTVEVVAQGEEIPLKELVRWLHVGPPWARVEDVKVNWVEGRGEYRRFEVRY